MPLITDWNDDQIEVVNSRGGVMAVADYRCNLIRNGIAVWPPAAILQKLYNSRHAYAYTGEALGTVTRHLGYYCDLQSIHSEDAITWSFFGPLTFRTPDDQAGALNWILDQVQVAGHNKQCEISLWRRVPHPETLVPGGPEIDFLLAGDRDVVLGDAKWRSAIGIGQGVNGDLNQIQLRQQFLQGFGPRVFGDRRFVVLGVWRNDRNVPRVEPVAGVEFRWMTWDTISHFGEHPGAVEFQRYLDWKNLYSQP